MSLSDVAVPINGDAEQRFESGNENLGQFGTRSILWCHQGRQRLVPLRPDLSREVGEVFSTIHSVPTGRD